MNTASKVYAGAKLGASVVVTLVLASVVVYFLKNKDKDNSKRGLFVFGPVLGFAVLFNVGYAWCLYSKNCRQGNLMNDVLRKATGGHIGAMPKRHRLNLF